MRARGGVELKSTSSRPAAGHPLRPVRVSRAPRTGRGWLCAPLSSRRWVRGCSFRERGLVSLPTPLRHLSALAGETERSRKLHGECDSTPAVTPEPERHSISHAFSRASPLARAGSSLSSTSKLSLAASLHAEPLCQCEAFQPVRGLLWWLGGWAAAADTSRAPRGAASRNPITSTQARALTRPRYRLQEPAAEKGWAEEEAGPAAAPLSLFCAAGVPASCGSPIFLRR